jgi:hypothetical protein
LSWRSREIAPIAISAALWSVLNATISPVFFALTKMPFLCDLLGILSLIVVTWRVRRVGVATATGLIAMLITLSLNPYMIQFISFGIAAIFFDLACFAIGYSRVYDRFYSALVLIPSVIMAFLAGIIIGSVFMGPRTPDFVLWWGLLHAIGGVAGGTVGAIVIGATGRRVRPGRLNRLE